MLVTIIEDTSFFLGSNYTRSYTDFGVECTKRIKIMDIVNIDKANQVVISKVQVIDDALDTQQETKERKDLVEELRSNAINYCMISKYGNSLAKQKAKIIQNCSNQVTLCYKAAALLTLARNYEKYRVLDTDNLDERLKITNDLLKSEIEIFKTNNQNEK
jgi:ATP-dependent Lon protease